MKQRRVARCGRHIYLMDSMYFKIYMIFTIFDTLGQKDCNWDNMFHICLCICLFLLMATGRLLVAMRKKCVCVYIYIYHIYIIYIYIYIIYVESP